MLAILTNIYIYIPVCILLQLLLFDKTHKTISNIYQSQLGILIYIYLLWSDKCVPLLRWFLVQFKYIIIFIFNLINLKPIYYKSRKKYN